jgi:hypothetical protein
MERGGLAAPSGFQHAQDAQAQHLQSLHLQSAQAQQPHLALVASPVLSLSMVVLE